MYNAVPGPVRNPDPTVDDILALTKFCDIETGLKILNSQSLRWSAPHLFNDPFELNYRTTTDASGDALTAGLVKEAINLLFGAGEPRGKSNRLVAAIARWRDEERFASEEEAESVLQQLLGQLAHQQQETIDQYLRDWRAFASSVRICCFCDKPTNMAAWQRYGGNHSGIALKFTAGEDTILPDPRKVSYSTSPPQITSLREQVDIAYGRAQPPGPEGFPDKLLGRNRDNNAEREWRCFDQQPHADGEDDQLWYLDKTFKPHELKGIYLGLAMAPEHRDTVLELARRDYKNSRVFQAQAVPGKYEIDFVQLGGR